MNNRIQNAPPIVDINKNMAPEGIGEKCIFFRHKALNCLISFLFPVKNRLGEPIIVRPGSNKRRLGLELLKLEVLLNKEENLASSENGVQNLTQVCVVKVLKTTELMIEFIWNLGLWTVINSKCAVFSSPST